MQIYTLDFRGLVSLLRVSGMQLKLRSSVTNAISYIVSQVKVLIVFIAGYSFATFFLYVLIQKGISKRAAFPNQEIQELSVNYGGKWWAYPIL